MIHWEEVYQGKKMQSLKAQLKWDAIMCQLHGCIFGGGK